MPGVLIIEGMAQAAGCCCCMKFRTAENKLLFLAAVDGVRFRRPCCRASTAAEVTVLSWRGDFAKLKAKGIVDGQTGGGSDADVQDD